MTQECILIGRHSLSVFYEKVSKQIKNCKLKLEIENLVERGGTGRKSTSFAFLRFTNVDLGEKLFQKP